MIVEIIVRRQTILARQSWIIFFNSIDTRIFLSFHGTKYIRYIMLRVLTNFFTFGFVCFYQSSDASPIFSLIDQIILRFHSTYCNQHDVDIIAAINCVLIQLPYTLAYVYSIYLHIGIGPSYVWSIWKWDILCRAIPSWRHRFDDVISATTHDHRWNPFERWQLYMWHTKI